MLFAEGESQRREIMPTQILGNRLKRARKTEILRFTSVPRVSRMFVMPRTQKDKGFLTAGAPGFVAAVGGLCARQTPGVSAGPASPAGASPRSPAFRACSLRKEFKRTLNGRFVYDSGIYRQL